MLKLLIVDDEVNTRKGLQKFIKWEEMGIQICGEAQNGKEGLELAERIKPDIVITDVKMPFMDGIELSKRLKELDRNIKILLISGYNDVDYIKAALKLDAVDYILKPINVDELKTVICKILSIHDRELEQEELKRRMNLKLTQSMPVIRENFLITLTEEHGYTEKEIDEKLEFLEIDLPMHAVYCACIIEVDEYMKKFGNNTEKDKHILSFSILNIINEIIEEKLKGIAFQLKKDEYVCLLSIQKKFNDTYEMVYGTIKEIQSSLNRFLDIETTIGIGREVESLMEISKSCKVASKAVQQKFFKGKNSVYFSDSDEYVLHENYNPYDSCSNEKISSMVRFGNINGIRQIISELFNQIKSAKNNNIKFVQNICMQILLNALNIVEDLSEELNMYFNVSDLWQEIEEKETIDEVKEYLIEKLKNICHILDKRRISKNRLIIDKIEAVICEKFGENITIEDIAKKVYFTPAYISSLFKDIKGETINDYLTGYRMRKAVELLKDYRLKVYDVSNQVGYTDHKYFSKLFKKNYGITPSEYRKNFLIGSEIIDK